MGHMFQIRCWYGYVLLLIVTTGCASGPDSFQPTVEHDPGPWPVKLHDSYLRGYWLSFGPYRTDWAHAFDRKKAAEVGIQQVDFKAPYGELTAFEVIDAYGEPIYLASGMMPAEKSLKLGVINIPTSPRDTSGVIAQGGKPIAKYFVDVSTHGVLDLGRTQQETLTVRDAVLHVSYESGSDEDTMIRDFITGRSSLHYILNGNKVASLNLLPSMSVWIDQSLPRDMRSAIAVHAAQTCMQREAQSRQQAANDLHHANMMAAP